MLLSCRLCSKNRVQSALRCALSFCRQERRSRRVDIDAKIKIDSDANSRSKCGTACMIPQRTQLHSTTHDGRTLTLRTKRTHSHTDDQSSCVSEIVHAFIACTHLHAFVSGYKWAGCFVNPDAFDCACYATKQGYCKCVLHHAVDARKINVHTEVQGHKCLEMDGSTHAHMHVHMSPYVQE